MVELYCNTRPGPHEFTYRGPDGLYIDAKGGQFVTQVYFCKWCLHVVRRHEPDSAWWLQDAADPVPTS